MTILYVIDSGVVGGATKAFLDMVHEMRKLGVTPMVITGKHSKLNDLLESEGIKTVEAGHQTALQPLRRVGWKWPYSYTKYLLKYMFCEWRGLRRVESVVDFSKISLIHTNSARNTIGCYLSKKYKIPHITHIREFGNRDFNCVRLHPWYISILNKYSTIFISISKAVADYWISIGIDKKRVKVIYDGSYYHDISESTDEYKLAPTLNMIIAGGVYPTKGQHLAVEALGYLPEDVRKNITLDIAGWGDQNFITELKRYAQEHGYGNKVKFLGAIDDVHERTGLYQIGLMCSRSEGFGLVTSEYMHGRLGIIASDSGACPELISDGKEGLLFNSGDAKSLADCILRYYKDRDFLIELSNAAQKKARQCFTSELNAKNIYELYCKTIRQCGM